MAKKNICITLPAYWIEKTRIYCNMGQYSKAAQQLFEVQGKAKVICQGKDYQKFIAEIDKQLDFIEEQIEVAIRKRTKQRRSIELYEALEEKADDLSAIPESSRESSSRQFRPKLVKLMTIFDKECKPEI